VGEKPRYVITDKGREFFCARFKRWCRRRGIGLRFGAVGRHGSVVLIERFIRSVKQECVRRLLVPLRIDEMRRELELYCGWSNEWRPHEALGGRTPLEVCSRLPPANEKPRWEPRARWPRGARGGRGNESEREARGQARTPRQLHARPQALAGRCDQVTFPGESGHPRSRDMREDVRHAEEEATEVHA
jgi:hypothetical protein